MRYILAFILALAVPAVAQPTTRPICGVWRQPAGSLAKWAGRGINTAIWYEDEGGTVTVDQWCAAAAAAKLVVILQSTDACAPRWNDANTIAIQLDPDEPNGGNATPGDCLDRYLAVKLKTAKPVFINLDGWRLLWESDTEVSAYLLSADWIGLDYYVVNRGEGIAAWPKVMAQVDRLKRLAPTKRVIVFIECADCLLKKQPWANQPDASGTPPAPRMRGPTPLEIKTEVDGAMAHGAAGIAFFPDVIGLQFEAYDGTPDVNVGAITIINAGLGK